MHRPEWVPTFDPLASLIYSATGDSTHTVIVDGHIVMANRELCTIDLERQMAIVQEMRKQILDQTGLQVQRNWTVI
jgi:5-methylthioadenosine/S-adenosylhomocysteine deaminase